MPYLLRLKQEFFLCGQSLSLLSRWQFISLAVQLFDLFSVIFIINYLIEFCCRAILGSTSYSIKSSLSTWNWINCISSLSHHLSAVTSKGRASAVKSDYLLWLKSVVHFVMYPVHLSVRLQWRSLLIVIILIFYSIHSYWLISLTLNRLLLIYLVNLSDRLFFLISKDIARNIVTLYWSFMSYFINHYLLVPQLSHPI